MPKIIINESNEVYNHATFTNLQPGFCVLVDNNIAETIMESFPKKFKAIEYRGDDINFYQPFNPIVEAVSEAVKEEIAEFKKEEAEKNKPIDPGQAAGLSKIRGRARKDK